MHSSPCSSPAAASLRTVATVTAKLSRSPRNRPCDSARNPSSETFACTPPMPASSLICASVSVVALVQKPTCIPAPRKARTIPVKRGWMVGSPPVSVTRSTRQAFSLGISRLVMSSYGIDWPALVADTKQCAQCRLHRSSICTSAFLVPPSAVVRK